jgi:hypothetical protein
MKVPLRSELPIMTNVLPAIKEPGGDSPHFAATKSLESSGIFQKCYSKRLSFTSERCSDNGSLAKMPRRLSAALLPPVDGQLAASRSPSSFSTYQDRMRSLEATGPSSTVKPLPSSEIYLPVWRESPNNPSALAHTAARGASVSTLPSGARRKPFHLAPISDSQLGTSKLGLFSMSHARNAIHPSPLSEELSNVQLAADPGIAWSPELTPSSQGGQSPGSSGYNMRLTSSRMSKRIPSVCIHNNVVVNLASSRSNSSGKGDLKNAQVPGSSSSDSVDGSSPQAGASVDLSCLPGMSVESPIMLCSRVSFRNCERTQLDTVSDTSDMKSGSDGVGLQKHQRKVKKSASADLGPVVKSAPWGRLLKRSSSAHSILQHTDLLAESADVSLLGSRSPKKIRKSPFERHFRRSGDMVLSVEGSEESIRQEHSQHAYQKSHSEKVDSSEASIHGSHPVTTTEQPQQSTPENSSMTVPILIQEQVEKVLQLLCAETRPEGGLSLRTALDATLEHNLQLLSQSSFLISPIDDIGHTMWYGSACTDSPDGSSTEQQATSLGLLSRLGAQTTAMGRARLVDAVAPLPQTFPPLASLRSVQAATSVTPSVDAAAVPKDLAYSAVHNPLFGILMSPPATEMSPEAQLAAIQRRSASTFSLQTPRESDQSRGGVLLSDLCTLDVATLLLEASAQWPTHMPAAAFVWNCPPSHWLRSWVIWLVMHPAFERAMGIAVLLSCIQMWLEKPRSPLTRGQLLVQDSAVASFVALFAAEAVLKVITYGADRYWRSWENRWEVMSMCITAVLLLLDFAGLQLPKPIQMLWGLRAFQVVTRSRGMKQILNSMRRSLSSVLNVTLLMVVCLTLFAILGLHLFSGLFYSCNDVTVAGQAECVGTFLPADSTVAIAREWKNAAYTFDDLGSAFDSLLMVTTLSGYSGALCACNHRTAMTFLCTVMPLLPVF